MCVINQFDKQKHVKLKSNIDTNTDELTRIYVKKKITYNYNMIFWLVIVLIIACGYWYLNIENRRNSVKIDIDNSIGTYDEPAKRAFTEIENLEYQTTESQFLAGRIIDLNMNEGRINNVRVLNDITERYALGMRETDDTLDWFEIDQIENFADRHMDIMVANPHYNDFIEAVLNKRPNKINKTINESKNVTLTKKDALDTFVSSNIVYTNDSQNVHDSSVNVQLKVIYDKLKQEHNPRTRSDTTNEIKRLIMKQLTNESDRKRALRGLEEMKSGEKFNSVISANESDLIDMVWGRTTHAPATETELMQESIVKGLMDMSTNGKDIVCSNGRIARLIESLATLDPVITGVMTVEQIRNDALQESNNILTETINEYQQDTFMDENMKTVARSYDDPTISTDPENEVEFKNIVIGRITNYLSENYKEKLNERDYRNTLNHCTEAIQTI